MEQYEFGTHGYLLNVRDIRDYSFNDHVAFAKMFGCQCESVDFALQVKIAAQKHFCKLKHDDMG
ncbi:MAG: hypothetical protein ACWA40_01620 [Planktomarina sp.]